VQPFGTRRLIGIAGDEADPLMAQRTQMPRHVISSLSIVDAD